MNIADAWDCLVLQRTGKRCQSCRGKRHHTPASFKDTYHLLKARKICVRCMQSAAVRGVFCGPCHAVNTMRNQARSSATPRRRYPHQVRCHRCKEFGHFEKTCVSEARR